MQGRNSDKTRLEEQIQFIVEIDKLKKVYRQTMLTDKSRQENDAEHSWHLAVMAMLLSEHAAAKELDLLKVLKMVLIHDLVEIDAGDTFCYDEKGNLDKAEREQKAADRIFSILPEDQAEELRQLWEEFDEMETPESQFAAALDRLQPLIHNHNTDGGTWTKYGIQKEKIIQRNKHIYNGSPKLWEYATEILEQAIEKGWIKP
jgi:putative hydrolase of HD superfamily